MTLIEYATDKIVKGFALGRYSVKFDYYSVSLLLKCFPDRFLSYKNTVGIFLRLSDDSFEKLKRGELDLKRPSVLMPLFKEDGDNIHVIGIVSDSVRDMIFLARYVKDKSISWYSPDMDRLIVFERS